jgi:WD40 repeat protein
MLALAFAGSAASAEETAEKVSFYDQIRPIFQANCHGCHQPAFDNGDYVMTDFEGLVKGGESEAASIVAGEPEESYLIELITPLDGSAEMPKGKKPLSESEIKLIERWIAEGAVDDTPEGAKQQFDAEHPPVYTRPPVITSMDYAPDGQLLAIAGFHEVLLVKADGSELVARLIGVSERIESVQFSPDGKRLLVTGGLPGLMGEVQVWDIAERKLLVSVPITYDTVYGGSWSPDGKLIALGCSDNTVRAIESATGKQVLFQGAHNDWVRDTVFSHDGSHLMTVGRDMTSKLTEVATERFVDNITSITPGALKGGVNAIARHPDRDEIVVGGADGVAKVYRVFRLTARRIGDDANLIREMPAMKGRVFDVDVSADGKRIAAVSSLDGSGMLHVYSYEFNTDLPDDIKKIQEKTVQGRSADEKKKMEEYHAQDVKLIAAAEFARTSLYTVTFSPDGQHVAAAGGDGTVRVFDTTTGSIVHKYAPAPITDADQVGQKFPPAPPFSLVEAESAESLPDDDELARLDVNPLAIELGAEFDYTQLLVTGTMVSGDTVDVSRLARYTLSTDIANLSPGGLVSPKTDGEATLLIELAGQTVKVPIRVSGLNDDFTADFIRDVNPILSRLGCNNGTCHGSAKGKNGFKLSLRGYDPLVDVRALTDDLAARRNNGASPDDSLMLMKSTGAVPHVGGQVIRPGEPYYRIMRSWIAAGAVLDSATPRVAKIDVFPHNPVIQREGSRQQIRVIATYQDGRRRDVTREAFLESGNMEIATADRTGVMLAVRRGEAPVLARYEGAYASTTLTVMGDREGFAWREPEAWGQIDGLVAGKWQRMKILPSGLTSDTEFVRRVHLDLTGLPPTADQVREFLADDREPRLKRADLVDRLVGNDDYVEYWTNKWADLLQVNSKFLGREGAEAFRKWIREEVAANTPYDQFTRKILTASGSNKENPAASYYKILREPTAMMENTTHLFLAVRFNCNKCHDHPFERWTQDQYYETAAFFAQVGLKADPASGDRKIGGTAVEAAKPFYEVVFDKDEGEVTHIRTGEATSPNFPYACDYTDGETESYRERLAAWITSADNEYFAKSYVNRLWGYLLGVGLIEPIDDIRASNTPSNPELLDHLTKQFIQSGFDARHVVRLICKSRTYQLSIDANRWNEDDTINYSHALARRLPAEVLFDSIHRVTGSTPKIPGVPEGTRAAELPDSLIKLTDGFLTSLGRPPRESACECERSNELQLGPVMALISGPTVATAIGDAENAITKLVAEQPNDARLVNEIFLRVLNRQAAAEEIAAVLDVMTMIDQDHTALAAALSERETWWKERKPQLEEEGIVAIAAMTADLEAYQKQIAPKIEEDKRKQTEEIAKREAELKEYIDKIDEHVTAWAEKQSSKAEWHLLEPTELSASNGLQLVRQSDRSIKAAGDGKKGTYTIVVDTRLQGITGVRLEALPIEGSESGGPGLSKQGNFVVTEFEVQATSQATPDEFQKVELQSPMADFTQAGFQIAQAINGNSRNQQGWGVAPSFGVDHWATFQTKKPVTHEDGTRLKFMIHQYHNGEKHLLGRFRISVTLDPEPTALSLPESLKAALSMAADQRDDAQKQLLTKYFRKSDVEANKRRAAVATAKNPLAEDRGITQRKQTLEAISRPVADDARLVQLRKDIEQSTNQLQNERLTAAQDLTWALINNPAFLFNR